MMEPAQNIVKYTPSITELLPDYINKITCTEPGCSLIFYNKGQYNFHLTKHHKKESVSQSATVYHCPVEKCIYHVDRLGGRSCGNMRLIRQHYQKVHMKKEFVCECCGKSFLRTSELSRHQTNGSCGLVWQCAECGWKYGSREALMTHGKRKRHKYETERNNLPKVGKIAIPRNPKVLSVSNKVDHTVCAPQANYNGEHASAAQDQAEPTKMLNKEPTIVETVIDRPTLNDMVGMDIDALLSNIEPENLLDNAMDRQCQTNVIDHDASTQTYPSLLREQSQNVAVKVDLGIQTEIDHLALPSKALTTLVCDIQTQTEQLPSVARPSSTQTFSFMLQSPNSVSAQIANTAKADNSILPPSQLGDYLVTTETQTNLEAAIFVSTETQTNLEATTPSKFPAPTQPSITGWPMNLVNDIATQTSYPQCVFNKFNLVDIETQTNRDDLELRLGNEIGISEKQSDTYNSRLLELNPTYTSMNTEDFLVSTETQTSFSQRLLTSDNFLTDMETQTRHQNLTPTMANCLCADDFLVSTETQTSYEQCWMDTELGLADIETQTNWSYANEPSQPYHRTSTASPPNLLSENPTAKARSNCDDFLVTAETQTTFAQCLLDTTLESPTNSSDGLYTTQYTQTCDELLNELLFGDPENLQSAYTQT